MTFWALIRSLGKPRREISRPMTPRNDSSLVEARPRPGSGTSTETLSLPEDPDRLALFLDIDGTLLEIAERPELVEVSPDLLVCLKRLARRLNGALALITGRTMGDADSLFTGLSLPVGAVHGLERRSYQGRIENTGSREDLNGVLSDLAGFVNERPGLLLEDKGLTIALHYRALPELEEDVRDVIVRCLSGWCLRSSRKARTREPLSTHSCARIPLLVVFPCFWATTRQMNTGSRLCRSSAGTAYSWVAIGTAALLVGLRMSMPCIHGFACY